MRHPGGRSRSDDDSCEDLSFLVARARRVMWAEASHALEQAGESMHVFQVLSFLVRFGPKTQNDLAAATAQHPAGLCRLLSELEQGDLVRRRRDTEDMRKVQVAPTAKARALVQVLKPIVTSAAERVFAPLSEAERKTLTHLLEKVTESAAKLPCASRGQPKAKARARSG
jgi:DNA-binding MarR family transcriptional regulator